MPKISDDSSPASSSNTWHAVMTEEMEYIDRVIRNLSDSSCYDVAPYTSRQGTKRRRLDCDNQRMSSRTSCRNFVVGSHLNDKDGARIPLSQTASVEGAPPGLESQFLELRSILRPSLVEGRGTRGEKDETISNVTVFLMGPRGNGKTLVLERCLSSLQEESRYQQQQQKHDDHIVVRDKISGEEHLNEAKNEKKEGSRSEIGSITSFQHKTPGRKNETRPFRTVRLNGLLIHGDDVGLTVQEVIRQLAEIASRETSRTHRGDDPPKKKREYQQKTEAATDNNDQEKEEEDEESTNQRGKNRLAHHSVLRLRHSSFTSNLALLDEALRTARVDRIPILIVLDELDAFFSGSIPASSATGTNGAMDGFVTSFAGSARKERQQGEAAVTDKQLLLYHLLDRVADDRSFVSMVGITTRLLTLFMLEKRVKSRADGTSKIVYCGHASSYDVLVKMLLSKFDVDARKKDCAKKDCESSDETCQSIGSTSTSLKEQLSNMLLPPTSLASNNEETSDSSSQKIRDLFQHNYGLGMDMRWFCRVLTVSLSLLLEDYESSCMRQHTVTDGRVMNAVHPKLTADYLMEGLAVMGGLTLNDNIILRGMGVMSRMTATSKHSNDGHPSSEGFADPRLWSILDMPGSELAVLLSAKRILARDSQDEQSPKPLTYERIRREYATFRGQRYDERVLFKAFVHLMESDVIRPSADSTGGGPLQYWHGRSFYSMEAMALARLPLHVTVELDKELGEALKNNMLDCSTALREWGKRMN